jgi:hypothetical protein
MVLLRVLGAESLGIPGKCVQDDDLFELPLWAGSVVPPSNCPLGVLVGLSERQGDIACPFLFACKDLEQVLETLFCDS